MTTPGRAGEATDRDAWACPVCRGRRSRPRWAVPTAGGEDGVDADAFRPSSDRFGVTAAAVVRCLDCGHGSLSQLPGEVAVRQAYADASDPVSLREEPGQVETARRALPDVEAVVRPGRVVDLGCWTGSFLVAARERGWDPVGVEPSRWASARARERGLDVLTTSLEEHGQPPRSARLVVLGDVLEHLGDPHVGVGVAARLLEPGGALFATVPDAGSLLARALGRRWWSVLPMHLQYFTRSSLSALLAAHGFRVRAARTHPKVFSAGYYAERLEAFAPPLGRPARLALERTGRAGRLIAPDLRDRLAVVAIRSPSPEV